MTGMLYGVGVGPGDPEYMTLKAVRLIRETEVIAVPGEKAREALSYRIAVQAVPELARKELLALPMPMTMDREKMRQLHEQAARRIEEILKTGKNVVFLTLGDPAVYSTFLYVHHLVEAHGYRSQLVSGVTSFCAAAASADLSLAEWKEPLHILPAVHRADDALDLPGTYILMKSGRKIGQIRQMLKDSGRRVVMVENCGMETERIYRGAEEIPDDAGYYSLIIAKEGQE